MSGSTGCNPSGTCICKDKYVGSQCQQCMLKSIFKLLPIFGFYALILIDGFHFMQAVFLKRFFISQICVS